MCFFRKKKKPDARQEDRNLLTKLESNFDIVITQIEGLSPSLIKEAKKVKTSIHLLNPSTDKKVLKEDEDLLENIQEMVKGLLKDKLDEEKAEKFIKELKILISIRESKNI